MAPETSRALAELAAHMNKIEKRLKQGEQLREEVIIPAINELRYAGRRFVDAWAICNGDLTPERLQELNSHIIVARQYLQNADHDITDAICFFIHREINRMQRRYGANEMIRVYPEYAQFARHMQRANAIISGSRETRAQRAGARIEVKAKLAVELGVQGRWRDPIVLAVVAVADVKLVLVGLEFRLMRRRAEYGQEVGHSIRGS